MVLFTQIATSFLEHFQKSRLTMRAIVTFAMVFNRLPQDEVKNGAMSEMSQSTTDFLHEALNMPPLETELLWKIFCTEESLPKEQDIQELYKVHGPANDKSYEDIRPIQTECHRKDCDWATLEDEKYFSAILYTRNGPGMVSSQYFPNYCIIRGKRIYNSGIPKFLQVERRAFVHLEVAMSWEDRAWSAQDSAEGQAQLYNREHDTDNVWSGATHLAAKIRPATISSTFFLVALLRAYHLQGERLIVPSRGSDDTRFNQAMKDRTMRLSLYGNGAQNHFCDKCAKTIVVLVPLALINEERVGRWMKDEKGRPSWVGKWEKDGNGQTIDGSKVSVDEATRRGLVHKTVTLTCVVGDGVTVTRNRCAYIEHDDSACPRELDGKDKFCRTHYLEMKKCAVVDCNTFSPKGWQTCDVPSHRKLELARMVSGRSLKKAQMFRSKHRPKTSTAVDEFGVPRPEMFQVDETQATEDPTGRDEILGDISVDPKAAGKPKLRAIWSRVRTGAEFLLIAPCGMIIRRDTMTRGEGIVSVKEILDRAYPTKASMPSVFFYDSNCILSRHMELEGLIGEGAEDSKFRDLALPIDPFHFGTKHKSTDVYCQLNCNPACSPYLLTAKGEWVFNANICEITNAWFGAFQSICREMKPTRFEFYLDEMVLLHNQAQLKLLRDGSQHPGWYDFVEGAGLA